jgi:TonB family protein
VGNPNENSAYMGRIASFFYTYWNPPAAASMRDFAIVRIYILKSGRITKRVKRTGSGDPVYDKTVMNAVNAVRSVPPPPAGYPHDYVDIQFQLTN